MVGLDFIIVEIVINSMMKPWTTSMLVKLRVLIRVIGTERLIVYKEGVFVMWIQMSYRLVMFISVYAIN